MTLTLYSLGDLEFQAAANAPRDVTFTERDNWGEVERIGKAPALISLGSQIVETEFTFTSHPQLIGERARAIWSDIQRLRATKKPLRLTNSSGENLGQWVIREASKKENGYRPNGEVIEYEYRILIARFEP